MSERDQGTEHIAESPWNGRLLGNGPLALIPMTGSKPGTNDFRLLAADAIDQAFGVPFDQVGDFILAHMETVIVACNAAQRFWAIHDHLLARNEDQARQTLRNLARTGLIVDVELNRRRLNELPKGLIAPPSHEDPTPEPNDPRQLLTTFLQQCRQRARYPGGPNRDDLELNPAAFDELACRVRGRIALQRPARTGLRLRRDRITEIRQRFQEVYREACKHLHRAETARRVFRWEDGRIQCTNAGLPNQENERLQAWLETELESARDLFDCQPSRTYDSNGQLSTLPEDWAALGRSRSLVQDWRKLAATGVALTGLNEQAGLAEPRLRSEFEVFPRLHAQKPDLGLLRQLADEPFLEADSDTVLVVGRLRDLGVRCRVALGEQHVGHPILLGDLIRGGDEQVAQGQKLADQGRVLVNQGYDVAQGRSWIAEGNNLIGQGSHHHVDELADQLGRQIPNLAPQRWNDCADPEFRRGIIRCLLEAALESIGTEAIRQILAEKADWSLSLAHANELYGKFLVVIGDLGWFESEAWRWAYYRDAAPAEDGTDAVVHHVTQEFWERWDGRQGQPTVGAISRSLCAWPAGRPTGYDFHQMLCDDILSDTVFELVARDLDVVAVEGDQFVVRVSAVDPPFSEIAAIAQVTAQRHLKHLSVPCDVEHVEAW